MFVWSFRALLIGGSARQEVDELEADLVAEEKATQKAKTEA